MQSVLIVVHLMVVVVLVVTVLLQRFEGEALGVGGGGIMTGRGQASALTRATAILAARDLATQRIRRGSFDVWIVVVELDESRTGGVALAVED